MNNGTMPAWGRNWTGVVIGTWTVGARVVRRRRSFFEATCGVCGMVRVLWAGSLRTAEKTGRLSCATCEKRKRTDVRSNKAILMQQFVDALRECLGLTPLYRQPREDYATLYLERVDTGMVARRTADG